MHKVHEQTQGISVQQQQQIENVSLKIGDRLKEFYEKWTEVTDNKLILECIKGYKIPFYKIPKQRYHDIREIKDPEKLKNTETAINSLIEKGAVVESKKLKGQFLLTYFIIEKPDKSHRFILHSKKLNKYVKTDHFKLEDLLAVKKLISENDYMISIDMQDAYLLVPVHRQSQTYLMFKFRGKL